MQLLHTNRFLSPRTGRNILIESWHDPDKPQVTIIIMCEGCLTELVRRVLDSSVPNHDEIATRAGWSDAVLYGGHRCHNVSSKRRL